MAITIDLDRDTFEYWKKIIAQLSEKLPEEAIQRTRKAETKKGYDTDGYGYQYEADRFNNVVGIQWGFSWKIEKHLEGQYKSGQGYHEITVSCEIWICDKYFSRSCAGGHTSSNYGDALKGAITNAFKKTASFWGVGRDAYAGTIDDDNQPLPDHDGEKKIATEEDKAKLLALPESIKSFFRAMMWSGRDVIDFCSKMNWNHEEIRKAIEILNTDKAK